MKSLVKTPCLTASIWMLVILWLPQSSARVSSGNKIHYAPSFSILNPNNYHSFFPDQSSFLDASNKAPILDLPEDDENYQAVMTAFYYRIGSYRKHIDKPADSKYWVVSEFLPQVSWAGAYNTISAAAGHHISEGRWFWDAHVFVEDYIRFWYIGANKKAQRHIKRYTNWIYYAAWKYALLWDRQSSGLFEDTFQSAADVFRTEYVEKYLTNSTSNQENGWNHTNRVCWRQDDGFDAMEVSVSGGGCRPTMASVMWGEAMALVRAGKLLGHNTEEFERWASFSQAVVTDQHWNPDIESFAVIPPPKPSEYSIKQLEKNPPHRDSNCDLKKIRIPDQPVNVRELLAFMPWYYPSLLPSDNSKQAAMWARQFQWLLESTGPSGFSGPWGLRTVQRSTPCYNYSWEHGDCWNGPSWPYETSRVLTGLANLLVAHREDIIAASGMSAPFYEHLLVQYALQHTNTRAVNDTASPLGSGHIFENLHPDLGYWNNRERMYWRNDTIKNMGDDYNHSTFLDLILSGWLGIQTPSGDANEWLVVDPLIQAPHFAVDGVPYRGRTLAIAYDPDGTKYHKVPDKGFSILIDGKVVAHRPDVGRLVVPSEPPKSGLATRVS